MTKGKRWNADNYYIAQHTQSFIAATVRETAETRRKKHRKIFEQK